MSPANRNSGDDNSEIFVAQSDDTIARLGEIAALRSITDQLNRMGTFMQTMNNKVGEMHTDIAVMKLQDDRIRKLEETITVLDAKNAASYSKADERLSKIELRHAGEEGARKGFVAAREWAPTAIAIFAALAFLFKTGAIHL